MMSVAVTMMAAATVTRAAAPRRGPLAFQRISPLIAQQTPAAFDPGIQRAGQAGRSGLGRPARTGPVGRVGRRRTVPG